MKASLSSNNLLWIAYAIFVSVALYGGWHSELFSFSGSLALPKAAVWAAYVAFLGYSIYCSTRESLLETVVSISKFQWGRQIGMDLYIGLILGVFLIYLTHGLAMALLWLLPVLVFANLAFLLYIAIYFELIASRFAALNS